MKEEERRRLRFLKMSGAGNDFLVLDGETYDRLEAEQPGWVPKACRRGLSVGADGVLAVRRTGEGKAVVVYRNPDGSTAFCGNGTRCAARFAWENGWVDKTGVLETAAGDVPFEILANHRVRLLLPVPVDLGERILSTPAGPIRGRHLVAGVPHFVTEVEDLSRFPLSEWGPRVRSHPDLGEEGANFDLVSLSSSDRVRIRTWERGVERETLACGTGAVAAGFLVSARQDGREVAVETWSGSVLSVRLERVPGRPDAVTLAGDARVIFRGELDLEALEPPEKDGTG